MAAKLVIEIPAMNWAYAVFLEKGQEYSFGTSKANSFALPVGTAAERHAVVAWKDGWIISDCGSEAGTLVNGRPVSSAPLRHHDILKIGECGATFSNPEERGTPTEWGQTAKVAEVHKTELEQLVGHPQPGAQVPLPRRKTAHPRRQLHPRNRRTAALTVGADHVR